MRVLHLIRSTHPAGGGPVESIKQLGSVVQCLGGSVEVASLDAPGAPHIRSFPFRVHAMGPGLSGYGYAPRFKRWLQENVGSYDVYIVNGIWQYNSYAARAVLREHQKPYFVFLHGMLDPWFRSRYPLKHLKKSLYWPIAEYRVIRDATAVLFTSEEEKRLARRSFALYRCNEVVLGYGTSGPPVDHGKGRANQFIERYPHLRSKRILLFLGRLHEKKGLDLLIQAFQAVFQRDQSFALVIAGPGPEAYQSRLLALASKQGIADRVLLCGPLYGDHKWDAFMAAELFLLPSHQENFAVSVAEALACGVPVIISDKVNIWRDIQASEAGLVCDDTTASLTIALKKWHSLTNDQRARMRIQARLCYQSHFDVRAAGRRLYQLLDTAIARRTA